MSRIPRLSEHYLFQAEYFFTLGMDHSVWFYLLAAWFYEDEDDKEPELNYLKDRYAHTVEE